MRFTCSLELPNDVRMVPVARHFAQNAMQQFGVSEACTDQVALAITEACANVVEHSQAHEQFEVTLELNSERCVIEVTDSGRGFVPNAGGADDIVDITKDHGRGIFLMRALVDNVRFESKPSAGTVVHLEKELEFDAGAPIGDHQTVTKNR